MPAETYIETSSEKMKEILRMFGISCRGTGGMLLDRLSFTLGSGEILGILGSPSEERRAIGRVLTGQIQPEDGTLYIHEQPEAFPDVRTAQEKRIFHISPDSRLMNHMDLAENLCLIRPSSLVPHSERVWVKRKNIHLLCEEYLEECGVEADPYAYPDEYSRGEQYTFLVMKAMMCGAETVVLDSIGQPFLHAVMEHRDLIEHMRKAEGAMILIDSHIEELMYRCDRIYTFREGRMSGSLFRDEYSRSLLMEMML